jgi:hypothetical protein
LQYLTVNLNKCRHTKSKDTDRGDLWRISPAFISLPEQILLEIGTPSI